MRRLILCFLVLIFSLTCLAETVEARSPTKIRARSNTLTIIVKDYPPENFGQGGDEECMLCYCYNTKSDTAYAVIYYWDHTNGSEMKYFLIANPFSLEDIKDSDWIVGYKSDDAIYMLAFYEAKLSFDEETEAYWIDVQESLDDRLLEVDTIAQSVQEVLLNCAGFDTDTDKLIHVENLIATQNGYEVFEDDYHLYTYFN